MAASMPSDDSTPNATIIKLDQFLKWVGVVQTGGEAKLLIQSGEVKVNGKLEMRRGRKLTMGDRISVTGMIYYVTEEMDRADDGDDA